MTARVAAGSAETCDWKADSEVISWTVAMVWVVFLPAGEENVECMQGLGWFLFQQGKRALCGRFPRQGVCNGWMV
jgi:hypothetical protein